MLKMKHQKNSMGHLHLGLVFTVQVTFESILSGYPLWARFEWKITLQNNSWLSEYVCRVSCRQTCDGSAMCPAAWQWQAAEWFCQQHSWIKSLPSPSALLLWLLSDGSLAWFCHVCWLIVELLSGTPKIGHLTMLWAQGFKINPHGVSLA